MNDHRAELLRSLLQGQTIGALATLHNGRPAVSMVPFALAPASQSLAIHVSKLATHTQDMEASPAVALLVTAAQAPDIPPQALPRLSITGTAKRCPLEAAEYSAARSAYLARFPEAEPMFSFGDFSLFLIEPTAVRGVVGFGQAWSVTKAQYMQFMLGPQ